MAVSYAYLVKRLARRWALYVIVGDDKPSFLTDYTSLTKAETAARLLAGHGGKVEVVK